MTPAALRSKLKSLGLSQVRAAKELGIGERTLRRYASGSIEITQLLELALEGLASRLPHPGETQ